MATDGKPFASVPLLPLGPIGPSRTPGLKVMDYGLLLKGQWLTKQSTSRKL